MTELDILLNDRLAGKVMFHKNRLSFAYDENWRADPDSYPLSLSMPLAARDHPHAPINAFIWNLLPDNERTLNRWAKQFQISSRNPFALIGAVGEDCAGAVQFVRPERREAIETRRRAEVRWLDEREIGGRLRSVLTDAASGRTAGDNGQFSLAGAQPKTALLRDGNRWGVPSGRTPTTHILKPPAPDLAGHAENEHFCMNLARRLGLRTAASEVRVFDDVAAIVVERYDRIRIRSGPGGFSRIHQEDMCQALGVLPTAKYQNEGGPDAARIVRLIRETAYEPLRAGDPISGAGALDHWRFVDALIFNWIIGGTDAHAKNYSLLIGGEGTVRLAPLYDIASAYAVPGLQPQRFKLAMKVDKYYLVERIVVRHWSRWAASAGLSPDAVVARIATLVSAMPGAIEEVLKDIHNDGVSHRTLVSLARELEGRTARIAGML